MHMKLCVCWCVRGCEAHRPVEEHDLPEHLGHVGECVWRQAEAAGVDQLSDQLLPVLLHGLTNQLLPNLIVVLVLSTNNQSAGKCHNCTNASLALVTFYQRRSTTTFYLTPSQQKNLNSFRIPLGPDKSLVIWGYCS